MAQAPYKHARAVFKLLVDRAVTMTVQVPLSDEVITVPVFRGRIGDLYDEAGVSKAYYSKVRRILLDCGAIQILERGTIHAPSIVVVDPNKTPPVAPPNVKLIESGLTKPPRGDKIERRVTALENKLGGLDIVEALRNLENRLSLIEREPGES